MTSFESVFSVLMFAFGIYLIWIGIRMITDKKYRNYVANLRVEQKTKPEEELGENFVKFFDGPLRILIGAALLYVALSSVFNLPI